MFITNITIAAVTALFLAQQPGRISSAWWYGTRKSNSPQSSRIHNDHRLLVIVMVMFHLYPFIARY